MLSISRLPVVLVAAVLGLAACGEDEAERSAAPQETAPQAKAEPPDKPEKKKAKPKAGTEIVLAGSDFGDMLYDSRKQAIYVFENDQRGKSNCYDDCAVAWPPVYAKGEPVAGSGVRKGLLGTTKRRDGRAQVTYSGRPLYFYDHEDPGQVLCHNVDLNGGLWWVVGADGEPLA